MLQFIRNCAIPAGMAWLTAISAPVVVAEMVISTLAVAQTARSQSARSQSEVPVSVRDKGKGIETWVLLSGTVGGVSGMRQLESRLITNGFRVITIDVYALSVDSADVSFAAMAQRVDHTLERLHVERAHVVGHAHGGAVGLRLAASYPNRVSALDLIEVGALPSSRTASMSAALSLVPTISRIPGGKTLIRTKLVEGIRNNSGSIEWFDAERERAYTQPMLDNVGRAVAMAERLGESREPEDVHALVTRVRVPVTVVLGQSPHSAAPANDQISALSPLGTRLRVVRLRGVGHFPHEEAPDQVMRALTFSVAAIGAEIKQ